MQNVIQEILSRNPKKVLNKKENYLLYEAGIYGNKAQTWETFDDIVKSGWNGLVCIRSKKGINRAQTRYNIPLQEVPKHIEELKTLDHRDEELTFNQSMPDEHLLLQGEVMKVNGEVYLYYTTAKKPMNQGFAESSATAQGSRAIKIISTHLSEVSLIDLFNLLEEFPQSVIEFGAYAVPTGHLAHTGRNAVFWEVRNY